MAGGECMRVRADLVGGVAVGGDSIRPHDHEVDVQPVHDAGRGPVRYQRHIYSFTHELPCRQPRALQCGARLRCVDPD